ncbi:hypothetical protein HK100_001229 [Physocladia obscura]|uniref:Uncharacterized protein n=1 Tax=Physocladia obscura TaxID=109957 RepID=A0AAD5XF03_9FUNG|nr:hypothetical protein HK100_001229 [Physocladia obscura]
MASWEINNILETISKMNLPSGGCVLVTDPAANDVLADANCSIHDLLNVGVRGAISVVDTEH